MIRTIAFKEIHHNLHTLRFFAGMVISVVLTLFCVIILTSQYTKEMDDYTTRISLQDNFINTYAHQNRLGGMIVLQEPPERFRPLVIGMPRDTSQSFDDDPMPILFPHVDLIFIVSIIMSLLALLFSYDALTGERERGTLRLMSVYPVSRASIILGKWIGGVVSLMLPLMLSFLAAAVFINLHPLVGWGSTEYGAFLLLCLASLLYVSLFFLVGIMLSAFSKSSASSILCSLFAWVIIVLVIPNVSPYVAAQFYPVPSIAKHEREIGQLQIEKEATGRKLWREVLTKYTSVYGPEFANIVNLSARESDKVAALLDMNPALKETVEAFKKESNEAWSKANKVQSTKTRELEKNFSAKVERQIIVSRLISILSPYADFIYAATDLTGTGFFSKIYFKEISAQYARDLHVYVNARDKEARARDAMYNENSYLDLHDRPRFSFREASLGKRCVYTLPFIGVLAVFNLIFCSIAYVRFMRYDVR